MLYWGSLWEHFWTVNKVLLWFLRKRWHPINCCGLIVTDADPLLCVGGQWTSRPSSPPVRWSSLTWSAGDLYHVEDHHVHHIEDHQHEVHHVDNLHVNFQCVCGHFAIFSTSKVIFFNMMISWMIIMVVWLCSVHDLCRSERINAMWSKTRSTIFCMGRPLQSFTCGSREIRCLLRSKDSFQ